MKSRSVDPMQATVPLVQAGTVLDDEVVMHRFTIDDPYLFITVYQSTPIPRLQFVERLRYLNSYIIFCVK